MIHDYDEAVAYLEHLVATPVCNEPGAGLTRARMMLSHVGDPQERFATLHVTGSAGKGSTAAMAAVEPFPELPVTWSVAKRSCGSPTCASITRARAKPAPGSLHTGVATRCSRYATASS